jgi:hypothetical protein
VLEVSDDSGFLAIVVPAAYEKFVGPNWTLDKLFRHFVTQMKRRSLLLWSTGLEGDWRVDVRLGPSETRGFREASGPIHVVGGELLVTNFESLTMVAQFADIKLPEQHQQKLLVELPDGTFDCRVIQMFDPSNSASACTGEPDFVLEFSPAKGSLESWAEIPWLDSPYV